MQSQFTFRPSFTLRILLLGVAALPSAASAQPILDKVEQQLRQQGDGAPAAGPQAGAVEPGYLGVIADDRMDDGNGIRIMEVIAGGPAAKGGLQVGDVVTAIDRQPIRQMADMAQILQRQPAGKKLEFQVSRNGAQQRLEVTLSQRPPTQDRRFQQFGRQPDAAGEAPALGGADGINAPLILGGSPKLGVRTVPVTQEAAQQYRLPSAAGALVTTVVVGSVAEKAGIPLGAVIVAVNGQAVVTPEDLAGIIKRAGFGAEIEVTYYSRGEQARKRVVLPAADAEVRPELPGPQAGDVPPFGAPPPLIAAPARSPDESRIDALERRVRELEDRIQRLEAQQKQ